MMKSQRAIPSVYMRGGTSRALFFHEHDLPPGADNRDPIFCAALGSPDPYERQLDGMGGGITSLSKVAVIGPSTHPDAQVDYTFVQVDPRRGSVGYRGNCGNISAAVGPFALEEGLVDSNGEETSVVIHNTNTKKLIRARFKTIDGFAAVRGDFRLDGVAGSGSPIELAFLDPGGAATGKLLPTGRTREYLTLASLGEVEVSLVDACNPVVMVEAQALGLTGVETPAELAANSRALVLFEELRVQAALAMGLVTDPADARTKLTNLPLVAVLSRPAMVREGTQPHVVVRMISSGQPHKASPLTGAMCLAIAAQIDDTVVARIRLPQSGGEQRFIVAHASGLLPVAALVDKLESGYDAREAIVYRTARRLMDGRVYIPN
jgi:2-methylaconitate cis-trans-isomerase PrpF